VSKDKNLTLHRNPARSGGNSSSGLADRAQISGYRKPSKHNQEIFDQAVEEVALATQNLLTSLEQAAQT
jgi:hypothetical protein